MKTHKLTHYSKVPDIMWRWPNFTPKEIASKGDGSIIIDERALDCLQKAREICGKPFIINSAYRDPAHNKKVGGSKNSQHLQGNAFDISTNGHDRIALLTACRDAGFTGFGFYDSFLHVDTGRARWWGKRWPEAS